MVTLFIGQLTNKSREAKTVGVMQVQLSDQRRAGLKVKNGTQAPEHNLLFVFNIVLA